MPSLDPISYSIKSSKSKVDAPGSAFDPRGDHRNAITFPAYGPTTEAQIGKLNPIIAKSKIAVLQNRTNTTQPLSSGNIISALDNIITIVYFSDRR